MRAFYNEIDAYCCDWLSNLMDAGHITPGVICDKSIEDVFPDELRGFDRCHFFAGIGVWDYALNLAGWGERPVWTGSAPCQPFSAAGKGLGFADERHLWPAWHHLISECRPPVIFGEQVASKDVDPWIDLVFDDLEAMEYACAANPFPSAGLGAPHIRDRTFFVAHAHDARSQGRHGVRERSIERIARTSGVAGIVADASITGRGRPRRDATNSAETVRQGQAQSGRCGTTSGVANANVDRQPARGLSVRPRAERQDALLESGRNADRLPGPTNGFWRVADWLLCRDGKWRPVEPGTFPLAHGAPARVGRLRAYGNAINAEAAAAFIAAADEALTA
ncbi:DNA cytosine methyltransferase [Paraburkholderia caballeronis]|uniref:DNA (Cytosine-5)-methyltransferase 1 n=1 Tax=Paraburkholderia caballeronis TaxID=416943 RepID=A0A1H7U670_9BURK|nr:DNA cytosine methyltransferase [Paraburkholderia caballeronis]PXW23370.1 DNA (cytosine-5)-methyltransferase 1 [Paraburkholderia caballeronis]PXW98363.1 DNA (cytosine-5)-methyltransferase 1 [Paraburkholderia caballeronis]RAJ95093.1 DNA (cytosine-5)-methyltransferase 1 [Paraburkholderia caballeronis]SEC57503.1 DNA (cytosine-5)-methyltransferase 1 [Paraburkholderia caballeronis]SEL92570.1 DNA (cytosine-5)-methyltransferase 1 [Paraburkholderia caballeronis]